MKDQNGTAEKKEFSLSETIGVGDERGKQLISDTVDTVSAWLESDEVLGVGDLFKMVQEKANPVTATEGMLCGYSIEKTLSIKRDPIAMLKRMLSH